MLESIRVWFPLSSSLGRIATQRQQVFNAALLEFVQNRPRFLLGLANHGQVAHHLQRKLAMNTINQVNGFFARASASPVRNRAEGGFEPLDDFDLAKEVLVAFVCLWGKELDREGQRWLGVQVV
jgi:surfactin synthase thioesterase subunit